MARRRVTRVCDRLKRLRTAPRRTRRQPHQEQGQQRDRGYGQQGVGQRGGPTGIRHRDRQPIAETIPTIGQL